MFSGSLTRSTQNTLMLNKYVVEEIKAWESCLNRKFAYVLSWNSKRRTLKCCSGLWQCCETVWVTKASWSFSSPTKCWPCASLCFNKATPYNYGSFSPSAPPSHFTSPNRTKHPQSKYRQLQVLRRKGEKCILLRRTYCTCKNPLLKSSP